MGNIFHFLFLHADKSSWEIYIKSPDILIGGADNVEKRLGQSGDPATDVFTFSATLRVKLRKGGTEEVNISTVGELVEHRDAMMT